MNRNFIFASLLLAISLNMAIIGCHRKGENESAAVPDTANAPAASEGMINAAGDTLRNPFENAVIEIRTFKNTDSLSGFGYDIYVDNIAYVHQPHIPAIPGNMGFATEENAKRTGEYVAYKIRNNIRPPSVTPKELDSLGVLVKTR